LRLIIKADVQGSLDPIVSEVMKLGKGEIDIKIYMPKRGISGK